MDSAELTERRLQPAPSARGTNQSGMRAHNERLVLSLVRRGGPLSKAEIARLTGLSAQTVSVIMRKLEAEGLLKKDKRVRGKIGQPSVPMSLNAEGAFFFGLKVGRRSVELVLTDFEGTLREHRKVTYPFPTPDRVMAFARTALAELLATLTTSQQERVGGLGVAFPYHMWEWQVPGAEGLKDWQSFDIGGALRAITDLPVYLCNDTSAACGAELVFGAQDKPSDFLYLYIGYFAGGGLVLDSKLYTGKSGNAAALGSMPLPAGSSPTRQLVDVASLAVLEAMLEKAGITREASWALPDAWHFPKKIRDAWLDSAAAGLAQTVLAASCLIDFDTVVVDGTVPEAVRGDLVQRISKQLEGNPLAGIVPPKLREGSVGSDARSLGAASLPLSDRFLVDRNVLSKV
ncbi:Sugar kinase of the NBD/HSP70 family, may contain an N-terminal HTH domain [Sulfitobacter delicatus]|uniref:Sugar kinase of the NBD/HSP70 family, may contain an N-terminal HTH domain n=2 Tax=Sulfitobacter delicatus TaxID=218672 RepID=A0A1G7TUZ6_9RHOB|nr:Sugar kinase of the NBD/HSP70 family, may contain an N-terminal HTH domain [Sulfitobacter delicatus]